MSKSHFKTVNPTTEEVIAEHKFADSAEIESALKCTHAAQHMWKQTSFDHRSKCLRELGCLLRNEKESLSRLMTMEMGKPLVEARGEVDKCAMTCDYYAENAPRLLKDVAVSNPRTKGHIVYEPLGTVLAIMPWNFPFWQVIRFAAPNLMLGNAGILKHAPGTAGCAETLTKLFEEAGYPLGLFVHLHAKISDIPALIDDPRIHGVTLTGSTPAGKQVASLAGAAMKKSVFELGGSDPYIILEDADIALAAKCCAQARLLNSGQSCIAAKRFLVVKSIKDEFTSAFKAELESYTVGDPLHAESKIGPLARRELLDGLKAQVTSSLQAGAREVFKSSFPTDSGFFHPVHLLDQVKPGMAAFDTEMFGPVASIIECSSESEAISLANQSSFGLGSGLFTQDIDRALRIAREEICAGSCAINNFVKSDPDFPFGGIRESGYGRELGTNALHEFANIKSIQM